MKAEHRKELETNALAEQLGGVVHSFKEGPSRNAAIYGSIIIVLVIGAGIYWWAWQNARSTDSTRWVRWDQISSREELEGFAKENAGTMQGRLARYELARLDLVDGLQKIGSPLSRADAVKDIGKAATAYEALISDSGNSPRLTQEALFNAAKAREALGEIEKAREWYTRLARDYPQSLKGKEAGEQVKALESEGKTLEALKQLVDLPQPIETPDLPPPPPHP